MRWLRKQAEGIGQGQFEERTSDSLRQVRDIAYRLADRIDSGPFPQALPLSSRLWDLSTQLAGASGPGAWNLVSEAETLFQEALQVLPQSMRSEVYEALRLLDSCRH